MKLTATHTPGSVRRQWTAILDRHHELSIIESLEKNGLVAWTVSMPSGHTIATATIQAIDTAMAFDQAIDAAVEASEKSLI